MALFGRDPQQIEPRRRIGVMLQSATLPSTLRVGELLRLTASYYPAPRPLAQTAAMAGITDLLRRPYAKLSGGQQRRVQFALAICGNPELLFLDEPTVGLDIDARQKLWAAIRALLAEGCSVLLTTHYLEEAEALADRVCVMTHGRMLHEGSVEALRARVAVKRIRLPQHLAAGNSAWVGGSGRGDLRRRPPADQHCTRRDRCAAPAAERRLPAGAGGAARGAGRGLYRTHPQMPIRHRPPITARPPDMDMTLTIEQPAASGQMPRSRVLGAYLAEARSECMRYMRAPSFLLPVLLFPAAFYLMFGVLMGHAQGPDAARYLLASYGVFGVMSPGLFGFGVSLALERDGGLLTLKRALPMPPGAYLLGKMLMAMLAAGVVMLLLLALSQLAHVVLSVQQVVALVLTGMLGVLPFCALGMFVGTLIKGQGAPGVLNLVYLPMSFLSGLWFPLAMLPKVLQQIAPVWPSYHLHQLALAAVGMSPGALLGHAAALVGFAVVFMALAVRRLRRLG